jgi:hypothetical protein
VTLGNSGNFGYIVVDLGLAVCFCFPSCPIESIVVNGVLLLVEVVGWVWPYPQVLRLTLGNSGNFGYFVVNGVLVCF